ncbi:unnamed protein product [Linum tenue]|uniref:Uncharacterized protein n=1 Tax=Linum tenue TaxID=586396 RepID=A0AAV0R8U0_9ROSI|nr:unnamed protein product [Linum tenue]
MCIPEMVAKLLEGCSATLSLNLDKRPLQQDLVYFEDMVHKLLDCILLPASLLLLSSQKDEYVKDLGLKMRFLDTAYFGGLSMSGWSKIREKLPRFVEDTLDGSYREVLIDGLLVLTYSGLVTQLFKGDSATKEDLASAVEKITDKVSDESGSLQTEIKEVKVCARELKTWAKKVELERTKSDLNEETNQIGQVKESGNDQLKEGGNNGD